MSDLGEGAAIVAPDGVRVVDVHAEGVQIPIAIQIAQQHVAGIVARRSLPTIDERPPAVVEPNLIGGFELIG